MRLIQFLTNAFPVWVSVGGILALYWPEAFTWFRGGLITSGLAVIMLGMGMTLNADDFHRLRGLPRAVLLGFVAQYTIMPLLGFTVGLLFRLDAPFRVGLILVACCPGGTASNVVAYLARAEVALSVVMTLVSTLAAVVMTPLLTGLLVGELVQVDAVGLFLTTLQVVVAPVALGIALNRWTPRLVEAVSPVAPLLSVAAIVLICASIIGQSAEAIRASAATLLGAVFSLHAAGFALGYGAARLAGLGVQIARTVSIEVGMQNSGLGVVLARRHFADPLTAVPCAISSVFHSVIGSVLAGIWRVRSPASRGGGESSPLRARRSPTTRRPGPRFSRSGD